jgi:hypothetical protein
MIRNLSYRYFFACKGNANRKKYKMNLLFLQSRRTRRRVIGNVATCQLSMGSGLTLPVGFPKSVGSIRSAPFFFISGALSVFRPDERAVSFGRVLSGK